VGALRSICAATIAAVAVAGVARAGTPIAGLVDEPWVSGLTQPTGIAFLPGGDASKFLVIEKAGAVKLVDRSTPPPYWTTLGNIGVCTAFEEGLLGIVVYPDFDTTHHVYLYRTENDGGCGAPKNNQVFRVTVDPLVDLASLTVILGGIGTGFGAHNGGGMRIGPDGKLYVGVGDTASGGGSCPGTTMNVLAQDPNSLNGKILRIERDGTIPADNPFVGLPAHREEVFALGFRNPWRFGFDPVTGALWHGDVGAVAAEEIDIVTSGGNYGWPHCEGVLPPGCEQPGDVPPIYTYRHDGMCPGEGTIAPTLGKSITGGSFAGAAFGAFENSYVFGDFSGDAMYLAEPIASR
jgi:glucose/arabinose dehydrogenase